MTTTSKKIALVTGASRGTGTSGAEGNAVLRRALADAWPSGEELARQLTASVGDAGPAATVPEGDAAGAGREAPPQAAPADALKKCPFRGNRAPRRALVLGLVVLVGLGGYALHRANRRPGLPATGAQRPWTPAPGPSSPASPVPAAAGVATAAWDAVPPTASGTPQPAPSSGEADWAAAEQPAPLTLQALAALAARDSTLPPATPSPTPSPAETPVETTPVPGKGNDATPRAVVLPEPPASNPQALDDVAVLEQDGGAVTADNNSARVRWRHVDRPRTPARPSFWQWLFGHKETKKAKPGKPRH